MALLRLSVEALLVGLALAILGLFVGWLWLMGIKSAMSKSMFNQYYPYYDELSTSQLRTYGGIFAVVLFLTGVLFHLLAEGSGVNSWYCKNGNACRK